MTCQAVSVTQPDRLTWSCDHVSVTTEERPDPKDLSTFSQCTEFPPYRGFEHTSSRSGVSALTKWLASRMLVRVSAGFSTVLPPVPLWYCTWAWFSRELLSAIASGKWLCRQVSLPMMCQAAIVTQADRLTWSCAHVGAVRTTVERPDPKDLSTLVNGPRSRRIGNSNSHPPDLELGVLTKWLARRMLVWGMAGFSTLSYNETLFFCRVAKFYNLMQLWTPTPPTPPLQRTEEDDILISAVSVRRAYRVYKERPLYLHISAWQVSISKEGGMGGGLNTKRIATVPYIVCTVFHAKHTVQFQGVYFVLMAKVTIVWLGLQLLIFGEMSWQKILQWSPKTFHIKM